MRKKIAWAALMLAAGVALSGCSANKKAETEKATEASTQAADETTKTQSSESLVGLGTVNPSEGETQAPADQTDPNQMCYSYLSGKAVPVSIGRTRPIAFMFNNIYDAVPQYGIDHCDVVYEAPVEGGITRLMGISEDYKDVPRIGSIRSCRSYYVYYAREFDAIYAHFGQAVYALALLDLPETNNLSGLDSEGDIVYYRSDDRVSPHNVFTDYQRLQDGISFMDYRTSYADDYSGHYQFAADGQRVTLDEGVNAEVVIPGYSYNNARFEYDAATGQYKRFQYGDPQVEGNTNEQLTYDNILIQSCGWEPYDENGYLNIDPACGGSGWYITNGKAIQITWRKKDTSKDLFGPVGYYDMAGNEITLNQGKTWVCIVQDTYFDDVQIGAAQDLL